MRKQTAGTGPSNQANVGRRSIIGYQLSGYQTRKRNCVCAVENLSTGGGEDITVDYVDDVSAPLVQRGYEQSNVHNRSILLTFVMPDLFHC